MKKAIERAIEGGYRPSNFPHKDVFDLPWARQWFDGNYKVATLDPLFWQALGKAERWDNKCLQCGQYEGGHNYRHYFTKGNDVWKGVLHNFITHLSENKPIDDFFNQLLK